MKRRLLALVGSVLLVAGMSPTASFAREPVSTDRPVPASIEGLKLDQPITDRTAKIHTSLADAKGAQRVFVRLSADPVAAIEGDAAQSNQWAKVKQQHTKFIERTRKLDSRARVLGQTQLASNVVALRVDASRLDAIARDPDVVAITPVKDYQKALTETVPYVGATAVQRAGFSGKGIRVGVLDSGIDYTHVAFGGKGTAAAYEAAYGTSTADSRNKTLDRLFPTKKVVGGYDFVGERWPVESDVEEPDPDPIDCGPTVIECDGSHGTHVADIVGGKGGVAPGVTLYAIKVCSALSTACSGVAMIQGFDYAVDPNGDGRTKDHLDVVNLSLGSDYGPWFDDDMSLAIDRASKIGVLTVAAAGNGGDKPWIAGIPASARTAISVAQTHVPSALAFPLVIASPPAIAGTYPNTATVDWAPLGDGFSGDVVYIGDGCPGNPLAADPAGKVALIARGTCNVSLKVDTAAKAGAVAALIYNNTAGDAPSFSFGGGEDFVPTLVITQDLGLAIRAQLTAGETVVASVSDAVTIPLIGSLASTSSRGPGSPDNGIKPEIGAPGASVSALAGTGTDTEAFGGTSGATPMVAGAAALLRQAFPKRTPAQIKAVLMSTAETEVYNNSANQPGYLAPITRIGAGELRVDRALKSPAAVLESKTRAAAVSFGLVDVTEKKITLKRTLEVENYSSRSRTYRISSTFRFADDRANGAVRIGVPRSISVRKGGSAKFDVTLTIEGAKLREWLLDSATNLFNARALDTLEYDGYILLDDTSTRADDGDPLHAAWHVLPRLSGDIYAPKSARVRTTVPDGDFADLPAAEVKLTNKGVGPGYIDAYSLVGTSPNLPPSVRGANSPVIDLRAVGVQTIPVPAGFCLDTPSFLYLIAINTWERAGTIGTFPAEFDVYIDTDEDGSADFIVWTGPATPGSTADARDLTWVYDVEAEASDAWFFADSGTNDSNKVLVFCGDQIGLDASGFFTPLTLDVGAYDNYFTGNLTDSIEGIRVSPLGERYFATFPDNGSLSVDVAPNSSVTSYVADFGPAGTNPSETGLLLVTNAARGDVRGGSKVKNEAVLISIK